MPARSWDASTAPRSPARLEAHLTDEFTSRDLFGYVRGACTSATCPGCPGGYLKRTAEYTRDGTLEAPGEASGSPHPHNDPTVMDCSRCRCPAGAHEISPAADAREKGNDRYAVGDFRGAVAAYSRAVALNPGDARAYSNRAAASLALGDARGLSLIHI